jgi:hypothetical protein
MLINVSVTSRGIGPRVDMGQLGVNSMKSIARIMAGAAMVGLLGIVALPAFSQTTPITDTAAAKTIHPAPAPIAGAGLPVLAVGFGVYWLIRRRRRAE